MNGGKINFFGGGQMTGGETSNKFWGLKRMITRGLQSIACLGDSRVRDSI